MAGSGEGPDDEMRPDEQQRENDESRRLQAAPEAMVEVDDGFELSVRLRNPLDRTVHYVADVRAMIFDPTTRRLRVQLSDQGRELPPGGIAVQPQIRTIDPQSEAIATVRLPKTIVKLAQSPSPTGDVQLEEHAIDDADVIKLEIGWADTPYYPDPRDKSRTAAPVATWEQEDVEVTFERRKP